LPNVANELDIRPTVNIKFDGVAKQRIDISIPVAGLATDHDYMLGWLGQSAWGPRIAVIDTLRVDGDKPHHGRTRPKQR